MEQIYQVYVTTDEANKITQINSSAFLEDLEGWHKIDEGNGDKYLHAQNNYFEKGLLDENGCHNYKLDGETVTECSQQEKEEELAAKPKPSPSDAQRLDALEQAMLALMMGGAASV